MQFRRWLHKIKCMVQPKGTSFLIWTTLGKQLFCSNCPAPSRASQTTITKRTSNAQLERWLDTSYLSDKLFVTIFPLPLWHSLGCNFLAFQKPVVDLHTEIIDLCNTSPSLFVIYIFSYNLNTVIIPLSILVLLLLYTVLSGLAGEISVTKFWFLITI